jgi:hypothetical protein
MAGGRRRNPKSSTTPASIERRERDLECVRLRRDGLHWETIAQQLGYNAPGNAYRQFMIIMHEYPREDVETARDIEAERYDQLQQAIWAKCLNGDTWAIDRALKLMDQRARLLGLNKPVPQTFNLVTETDVDRAIRELTEKLNSRQTEVHDAADADAVHGGSSPTREAAPPS